MSSALQLFAACAPGLEELLEAELQGLGIQATQRLEGGVEFPGDAASIARVNLGSGLATHLLVRLEAFACRFLSELQRRAARGPWGELFRAGERFAVRASAQRSKLYHSGAIENEVGRGIERACGARPLAPKEAAPPGEHPVVLVRVRDDRVTISLDTTGTPLHRRGWRLASGKAPLREDYARALLLASGWDPATPLLDPLMGSGTLVVEAALLARRLPPGASRSFAYERTRLYDAELHARVRAEFEARALPSAPAPIHGSDRSEGALAAARANAERAGVLADLELAATSFGGATWLRGDPVPPERGAVVTNPPHGRRLGRPDELLHFYQALGHRIAALPPAWRVGLLVADRRLALRTGLGLETAFLADSGGMKVRALVGSAGRAPDGAASRLGPGAAPGKN